MTPDLDAAVTDARASLLALAALADHHGEHELAHAAIDAVEQVEAVLR